MPSNQSLSAIFVLWHLWWFSHHSQGPAHSLGNPSAPLRCLDSSGWPNMLILATLSWICWCMSNQFKRLIMVELTACHLVCTWDDSCSSSVCLLFKITCVTNLWLVSNEMLENQLYFMISPLLRHSSSCLRVLHGYWEAVKIKHDYSSSSNRDKASLCQPVVMAVIAHWYTKVQALTSGSILAS